MLAAYHDFQARALQELSPASGTTTNSSRRHPSASRCTLVPRQQQQPPHQHAAPVVTVAQLRVRLDEIVRAHEHKLQMQTSSACSSATILPATTTDATSGVAWMQRIRRSVAVAAAVAATETARLQQQQQVAQRSRAPRRPKRQHRASAALSCQDARRADASSSTTAIVTATQALQSDTPTVATAHHGVLHDDDPRDASDDSFDLDRMSTSQFIPLLVRWDVLQPSTELLWRSDAMSSSVSVAHSSAVDALPLVSTTSASPTATLAVATTQRRLPAMSLISTLAASDTVITQQAPQRFPSFELVVELEAARDLLIPSPLPSSASADARPTGVCAELSLVHKTQQVVATQTATASGPSASSAAPSDVVHWDAAATLRLGIEPPRADDLNSATTATLFDDSRRCVYSDPQRVVDEWSVCVLVKLVSVSGSTDTAAAAGRVLGKLEVPLALLETPLASAYTMARWFPLERASPGALVRGDVRVCIGYWMHATAADGRAQMVAYAPAPRDRSSADLSVLDRGTTGTAAAAAAKAMSAKRATRQRTVASASGRSAKRSGAARLRPSSGDRNGNDGDGDGDDVGDAESLRHPDASVPLLRSTSGSSTSGVSGRSPKTSGSASSIRSAVPSHRRSADAHALSPPASPLSSRSSPRSLDGSTARRHLHKEQQQPGPKRATAHSSSTAASLSSTQQQQQTQDKRLATAESTSDAASCSPTNASTRAFLKRKPYKVVFRKLDWSRVAARTDSSWGARSSSTNAPAAASKTASASSSADSRSASSSPVARGASARTRREPKPATDRSCSARTRTTGATDAAALTTATSGDSSASVRRPATAASGRARVKRDASSSSSAAARTAATALDPATAARLRELCQAVYACCRVTQETAPLALLKYQTERAAYVSHQLSSAAGADVALSDTTRSTDTTSEDQNKHTRSALASKSALSTLWRSLVDDASDEHYATQLRLLQSERDSLPVER